MTVTSLDKDLDSLTLTLIADFDALSNASGNSGPTLEARALVVTADVPGDGGRVDLNPGGSVRTT